MSVAYSEILAKTGPDTLPRLSLFRKRNIIGNIVTIHFEIIQLDHFILK